MHSSNKKRKNNEKYQGYVISDQVEDLFYISVSLIGRANAFVFKQCHIDKADEVALEAYPVQHLDRVCRCNK